MGLIDGLFNLIFGSNRNVLRETVEVFRPNAEAQEQRSYAQQNAALRQFSSEFSGLQKSRFDRFIDGLNRLPRPLLAFGTLGLFVAAMVDPIWFSSRMQGIALVPEPLWWLLGAIVSFYFGARHQFKGQEFQKSIAESYARFPQVVENIQALEPQEDPQSDVFASVDDASPFDPTGKDANAALEAWRRERATR